MSGPRITVRHLVSIRVDGIDNEVVFTREQARELYDALHAEFGGYRIDAGTLATLSPEWVSGLKVYREAEPPTGETGPSLQDDIERMIADQSPDAGEMVDDGIPPTWERALCCSAWPWCDCDDPKPSNTPEPIAEPETAPEAPTPSNDRQVRATGETDAERAVRLWGQYRDKYPQELPNATVSRVKSHLKKLTADEVRGLLRSGGIDIPEPMSAAEAAAIGRERKAAPVVWLGELEPLPDEVPKPKVKRQPPFGYVVTDADVWNACASMVSDSEIRDLASGGLARIGLAEDGGGW